MDPSGFQTTIALSYVVLFAGILLGVFLLIGLPAAGMVWILKSRPVWVRVISGAITAIAVSILVPVIALQFQGSDPGPINIMRAD